MCIELLIFTFNNWQFSIKNIFLCVLSSCLVHMFYFLKFLFQKFLITMFLNIYFDHFRDVSSRWLKLLPYLLSQCLNICDSGATTSIYRTFKTTVKVISWGYFLLLSTCKWGLRNLLLLISVARKHVGLRFLHWLLLHIYLNITCFVFDTLRNYNYCENSHSSVPRRKMAERKKSYRNLITVQSQINGGRR